MRAPTQTTIASFAIREEGSGTVSGLFITLAAAMCLGLTVDYANAWRVQTQLQVAADAAALAAATTLHDLDAARTLAETVAARNLGTEESLEDVDIVFGAWDETTNVFDTAAEEVNAVHVMPRRTSERGTAVSTFLLDLVGVSSFDLGGDSIAVAQIGAGEGDTSGCEDAVFLSDRFINTGPNNTYRGAVCVHGETGVQTGGGAFYSEETRISAPSDDMLTIGSYSPAELSVDELTVERSMGTYVLPQLPDLWQEMHTTLYRNGLQNWPYSGGLVPSYVFNPATGTARVVRKNGFWNIRAGDIQPYTIYVINGSAAFQNGASFNNAAVLVTGNLNVTASNALSFNNVFISANQMDLRGPQISWGPTSAACDEDRYNVYLFARNRLQMGSSTNTQQINNVMGVSPRVELGSRLQGSGMYFEMNDNYSSFAGGLTVEACGTRRLSEFGQAEFREPIEVAVGSYLVH